MTLRIHSLMEHSTVNGPGRRAVVWFRGCGLKCPQCWNPETHSRDGGTEYSPRMLLQWLAPLADSGQIDGLSFSGDEPLEQDVFLLSMVVNSIRIRWPHLSIGMFSGYTERELEAGNFWQPGLNTGPSFRAGTWLSLRAQLDFAVLGRFNALAPANDPMTTSSNQRITLFTDRYSLSDFQPQAVEVQIDGAGLVNVTGFPTKGELV